MAFKEFGVLFQSTHVCQGGYYPTEGIMLIISENDIYQVPFLPGPNGPMHHKSNPHIIWPKELLFHDFLGQKIGEPTLLHHSDKTFRIEDLAHTIRPLNCIKFWESTSSVLSKMGVQDDFIEEVKYRQTKNDKIEDLELKTAEYVNEIARLKRHIQSKVYKKDCHDRVEYLEQLRAENAITIYELEQYKLNSKAEIACLIQKQSYTKNDDMPLVVSEEIQDTTDLKDQEIAELKQKIAELTHLPDVVAESIPECACIDLKAQVQSLKLQLATEKRISQKYARDLQERDKQQSVLTAM